MERHRDWSLVHLMGKEFLPHLVIAPRTLQVAHIGLEGGLHEDSINARKRQKMEKLTTKGLNAFHAKLPKNEPETDDSGFLKYQTDLHKHDDGFGGWGHPADQQHCMRLFEETRMHN